MTRQAADADYLTEQLYHVGAHPAHGTSRAAPPHAAEKQLWRIVAQVREAWPGGKITIRDPIMTWCEAYYEDYVLGLAQNPRLLVLIAAELEQARSEFERTKQPARAFAELQFRTLDS